MDRLIRTSIVVTALLVSAPPARAQALADPSGHWEGSIRIPGRELTFEVDLVRNGKGELSGTTNNPAEHIKGLPLRSVVVEGRSVSFNARRDQPLTGTLSADGQSMFGDATVSGYVLPFSLRRTGDAVIAVPARSAPIGKALEGTWNAAIDENGVTTRFVLTMTNDADGTATGRLVSLDEGELEIPLAITQQASSVTLVATVLVGSFSGALNSEGTELAGTWNEGPVVVPVTFRRARD
jgi:hypothetical protein